MDIRYGIIEKIMLSCLQELIKIYDIADRVSCIDSDCNDVSGNVTVRFYCRSTNFKSIHKQCVSFNYLSIKQFPDMAIPQMVKATCSREFSLILLREEFYDKFAERTWKIK